VILHTDAEAAVCPPAPAPSSPADPPSRPAAPPPPSPAPAEPAPASADGLPAWSLSVSEDGTFFATAWLLWLPCAALGVAAYVGGGACGLSEAKRLRRADALAGTRSGGGGGGGLSSALQHLPARLQFAAGSVCSELDESEVVWAGQPVLLVAGLLPVVLWAVAMLVLGVLTAQLEGLQEQQPRGLGLALVLLPAPLTLPLLLLLRRTQGTLYLLTARGAAVLTLQCACLGRRDAPRRTRYAQMLAQPVLRRRTASLLCAGRLPCADLLFASSPAGGPVGCRCTRRAPSRRAPSRSRCRAAGRPAPSTSRPSPAPWRPDPDAETRSLNPYPSVEAHIV
jgi:hypothetical protein